MAEPTRWRSWKSKRSCSREAARAVRDSRSRSRRPSRAASSRRRWWSTRATSSNAPTGTATSTLRRRRPQSPKAAPLTVQKTAAAPLRQKLSAEFALGRILFHAAGAPPCRCRRPGVRKLSSGWTRRRDHVGDPRGAAPLDHAGRTRDRDGAVLVERQRGQGHGGDNATIVTTVELPPLGDDGREVERDRATPQPAAPKVRPGFAGARSSGLDAGSGKEVEHRTRVMHIQVSVSRTARDTEPLVSVSSSWGGREQIERTFEPAALR